MDNRPLLTTKEISVKASSKYEVYRLLKTDGNVYLPPEKEANHRFLSDIITGNVKVSLQAVHRII